MGREITLASERRGYAALGQTGLDQHGIGHIKGMMYKPRRNKVYTKKYARRRADRILQYLLFLSRVAKLIKKYCRRVALGVGHAMPCYEELVIARTEPIPTSTWASITTGEYARQRWTVIRAASSRGESNMCYHAHSHLFKFIMGYQFLYVKGYMRCHEGSLGLDLDLDSNSLTDFTPVTLYF